MKFVKIFSCILIFISCQVAAQDDVLFDNKPANYFEECFPLGNGRIGVMPDGAVAVENIVLNDITLWSGCRQDADNIEAQKYLSQIRKLISEGKNDSAQNLMYQKFVCSGKGSGFANGQNIPYGSFQILGNLQVNLNLNDNELSGYSRTLNVQEAVYQNVFNSGKIRICKEYFTSFEDDVFVMNIRNSLKNKEMSLSFSRDSNCLFQKINDNILKISGFLSNGNDSIGMRYVVFVGVDSDKCRVENDSLLFFASKQNKIVLSWATNYNDADYESDCYRKFEFAMNADYSDLKRRHILAYKEKYDRVSLSIDGKLTQNLTTRERLLRFQNSQEDLSLINLYFNYGRYLFISSCREDLLPPNLQGLWANTFQTPWNGDYHLNINLQMNHWFAEVCGLGDLQKPLIDLTKRLADAGNSTAKAFYGADGWVAHVITNVWDFTAPGEHPSWGATNTCGAWLCRHLWQHFEYSSDTNYLCEIFPVIEGSVLFFNSSLYYDSVSSHFVNFPSSSPENSFYLKNSDKTASVCMGPTFDNQILRELYTDYISAAEVLGIDNEIIRKAKIILPKLPPTKVGSQGQILEWLDEYKEVEPQHRHVSHLYGLYPANEISPFKTPILADGARKTLEIRGDGGTGWSIAWKINFWARLLDGDKAAELLKNLLFPAFDENGKLNVGGSYPNLFCSHPPFQIDGNFGGAAGIAEMLLQNTDEIIYLPALPGSWKNGNFKNFRLKNDALTSAEWKNGKLVQSSIIANSDAHFKIRCLQKISKVCINDKKIDFKNSDIVDFQLFENDKLVVYWEN